MDPAVLVCLFFLAFPPNPMENFSLSEIMRFSCVAKSDARNARMVTFWYGIDPHR